MTKEQINEAALERYPVDEFFSRDYNQGLRDGYIEALTEHCLSQPKSDLPTYDELELIKRVKDAELRSERDYKLLMDYMHLVQDFVGFSGPIERVREELNKKINGQSKDLDKIKEEMTKTLNRMISLYGKETEMAKEKANSFGVGFTKCFELITPYIQSNDAVEFAEWINENRYSKYFGSDGPNCNKYYKQYTTPDRQYFTMQELYQQFKEKT